MLCGTEIERTISNCFARGTSYSFPVSPNVLSAGSLVVSLGAPSSLTSRRSTLLFSISPLARFSSPFPTTVDTASSSFRLRASTTLLRDSNPPSYPNHVCLKQCGPRRSKTNNCQPYHARFNAAAGRHPCSINTFVPTAVPITCPIKSWCQTAVNIHYDTASFTM